MTDPDSNSVSGAVFCAACGYNLQGLPMAGSCPECGRSARHSVVASLGLRKRELAELACKVLALWIIASSVDHLGGLVWTLLTLSQQGGPPGGIRPWGLIITSNAVPILLKVVIALALWWTSSWLAARMVRQDGMVSPRGRLHVRDLMVVAFVTIGIYLVATGLEDLVGSLIQITTRPRIVLSGPWMGTLARNGVRIVVGVALIVGAGALARFVRWSRLAGTQTSAEPGRG